MPLVCFSSFLFHMESSTPATSPSVSLLSDHNLVQNLLGSIPKPRAHVTKLLDDMCSIRDSRSLPQVHIPSPALASLSRPARPLQRGLPRFNKR